MRTPAFIIALLISSTVSAQELVTVTKQMSCSNTKYVMNEFFEKWGETPVWISKTNDGTNVTLLVNKEKKTWTLLEYDDSLACIIDVGEGGSNLDFDV